MKAIKIMNQQAYCDDNGYWFKMGDFKNARVVKDYNYQPSSELETLPPYTEAKDVQPTLFEITKPANGYGYSHRMLLNPSYVRKIMTKSNVKKYVLEFMQEVDHWQAPILIFGHSNKGEKVLLGGVMPMRG